MDSIFYSSRQSKIFANTNVDFIITSRIGGVSTRNYESLNLAYHTGDDIKSVDENRKIIHQNFYPKKNILWVDQIHSDGLVFVENKTYTKNLIDNADGIICNQNNVSAMIMVADCNPILVFDKANNVFAILHAGREGVCKKILTKAILKLKDTFKTQNKDILIFIGPSIRKCCYKIGEDLAKNFESKYIHREQNYPYLDLIHIIKDELTDLNISNRNIQISPTCSHCEKNLFSYRREGVTGRFALIASLKS